MPQPHNSLPLGTLLIGGLPFYLGAAFLVFPKQLSSLFIYAGSAWPELSKVIYSPKAMRIYGLFWLALGAALWGYYLAG